MKTCKTCQREKVESEFYRLGPGRGLRGSCKDCFKQIMKPRSKNHYNENKGYYRERNRRERKEVAKFLKELKSRPCLDCKIQYPYYVMQFDHIRDKKRLMAHIATHGMSEAKREAAKCEIVCANCHAERTYARMKAGCVDT